MARDLKEKTMSYLPSTAPPPNNSLTPIPQSVVDLRNAKIGLLGLLTTRARSITDCYAPAVSFIPLGLNVTAQVAQAQANVSTDTIASGTDYGTPAAPSSGNLQSSNPAPVVLPLNQISYGTPGGASISAVSSCDRNPRQTMAAAIPQPKMMMPQAAPAVSSPAVMTGLSGYAPPWGTYLQGSGSVDWLATLRSNPLMLLVIAAAGVWGLSQMGKGRR